MSLTDVVVRQARATGKDYTLGDQDGLSLCVLAGGSKSWHFRYSWMGRQKRMSFGSYPEISLREARALRDEARALLAKGVNPRIERRQQRFAVRQAAEHSFEAVFTQWHAHRALTLRHGRQTALSQVERVFAKDVLPVLGKLSIYDIRRHHLLDALGRVEQRDALSVAKKIRTWFNQMFRYALVKVPGLESNPASDLDVVAQPQPPVRNNPFLRLEEMPPFLKRLRRYRGRLQTQLWLRLLLLTGVRTGELRLATPDQFHLDEGLWIIPPETVKQLQLSMRKKRQRPQDIPPYIVPLSAQATEIVRHLLARMVPAQRYLFHHTSNLKKRISENTLNAALKRMGYADQLTGHGIRGTISTALNEIGYPLSWVDAQLSHVDPHRTSATYNHARYVEPRRRMMQDWADRLDLLEQDRVEAASAHLAVRIEDDDAVAENREIEHRVPVSPMLRLVARQEEPAPIHRLSAVRRAGPEENPSLSPLQRERILLLDILDSPHNLPVAEFAKLTGKSRRWVNYEIQGGNLLAVTVGNRGQRVPDWHLDPVRHRLIQAVLKQAWDADPWQIYHALSRPNAMLDGQVPVQIVTQETLREVVKAVGFALRTPAPSLREAG